MKIYVHKVVLHRPTTGTVVRIVYQGAEHYLLTEHDERCILKQYPDFEICFAQPIQEYTL